ncbi:MAG: hypothetical protein ACXV5P_05515 [Halobacteriota archaeon]
MDRRYAAVLFAVVIVLITVRVSYSLTVWGDSVDPDPWKLLGDTNRYVVTGHYSPGEADSLYYGAYSVGLQSLLASLTVFTGIDLITLAQYFLQVMVPIVMVIVIYLVTSRSGAIMSWAIPLMCLFIGLFSGITHQQSRLIEENVGFLLFCAALFFLYMYYDARRTSRVYTFAMLSAILLLAVFTHHISFLVIAVLIMPFVVSTLKYASPAYVPLIFIPWWIYYHFFNGYNGIYVGIFAYTAIGLAALYALFLLFYSVLPASKRFKGITRSINLRAHQSLRAFPRFNKRVGVLTITLGIIAIVYSLLTGLQSGYLPYFLPLAPLVIYSATSPFLSSDPDRRAEWPNAPFIKYIAFTLTLLIIITVLGFALQYTANRTSMQPSYFSSIEALAAVDLGNRFLNWTAFLWGLMATIGLVSVFNDLHLSRRSATASVVAVLLALAVVNTAVPAASYDSSFTITAPPDHTVVAAASWARGEDVNLVTLTDYNSEMLYWYYTNERVTHPQTTQTNYTVLDFVYPWYLMHRDGPGKEGINYLLLTSTPEVYYYEHLFNGQWKLSNQDTHRWQARLEQINNWSGVNKIYTNNNTSYYKTTI